MINHEYNPHIEITSSDSIKKKSKSSNIANNIPKQTTSLIRKPRDRPASPRGLKPFAMQS